MLSWVVSSRLHFIQSGSCEGQRKSSPCHSSLVFSRYSACDLERLTSFSSTFQRSDVPTFFDLSLFLSKPSALFCAFLHFFALAQNSTLFFSSDSELFRKNTGGWGYPLAFHRSASESARPPMVKWSEPSHSARTRSPKRPSQIPMTKNYLDAAFPFQRSTVRSRCSSFDSSLCPHL